MKQQETRGKIKQVEGRAKEAVGIVTGDSKLEREGARQRVEGSVQEGLGKARRKVGEAIGRVAEAIKA